MIVICTAFAASVACMAQGAADRPARVGEAERTALLEGIAGKLVDEYIDLDIARRMSTDLRQRKVHGEYDSLIDPAMLASQLTTDLRAVSHDKHLWVEFHAAGAHDEPAAGPSSEILQSWRAAMARDNFGFDKAERLDGNVGYVAFHVFAYPSLAAATATAAMSFVANTDALIIDLRRNVGGDPQMVAFMLSHLFDERTRLNGIYTRRTDHLEQYWTTPLAPGKSFGGKKPVYVLTSRDTFSAAEDFAYAVKHLRRGTLVGETTGGGAHPSRAFRVTQRFAAVIPYARSISPVTKTNWEGTGVIPDVATDSLNALNKAYRLALQRQLTDSIDEAQRIHLRAVLDSLPSE